MQKTVLAIVAVAVAAILGGAAWLALQPSNPKFSDAMVNAAGASIGGPFELVAHTGQRMTAEQVIDRPTLVYFGYTFCPDVCPIDVQVMADTVEFLAERGIEVQPVFITIDPQRDTPKELSYYAEAMHPKMIALTGTEDEIRVAADAYKVFYARVGAGESAAEYLMQHSNFTYLMLPDTGIAAVFKPNFPPEKLADDIEAVLQNQ